MMKPFLLLPLFIISLFNSSLAGIITQPLVNAEWLLEHSDEVIILDTRKELNSFKKEGHIENAVLVNVNKIRIDRSIDGKKLTRMRPDAKSFQSFMRAHGINADSNVVITHRGERPDMLQALQGFTGTSNTKDLSR